MSDIIDTRRHDIGLDIVRCLGSSDPQRQRQYLRLIKQQIDDLVKDVDGK